jgi:sodium-dependent dicarboxylate transporter 2/3/5
MTVVIKSDGPRGLPEFIIVACVFACVITNFMSNVAAANILMPALSCIGPAHGHSPLLVLFPVVMATSLAMLFPIGSPPNAIILTNGTVTLTQMMKVGAISTAILLASIIVYSIYILPLFPFASNIPSTANDVCGLD